ncbi:MAG TPA: PAS domain-containing protein [Planctomycetota bacterium]|nr:PAS domain-containing protein [Planctomycetota bacterium]
MNRKRILVVEDDRIVATDLRTTLLRLGFEPLAADPGERFLDQVAESHPDLVLMDIRLSGRATGVDLARAIRKHFAIPVVYLTAHADAGTLGDALTAAPYGYLVKPFDEVELHATIQVALYKSAADREIQRQRDWLLGLLRSTGAGVLATDASGRVVYLNEAATELTGFQEGEAFERPLKEVLQAGSDGLYREVERMLGSREPETLKLSSRGETTLTSRDGRTRVVDVSCAPIQPGPEKPTGVVVILLDRTERQRYRSILEGSEKERRLFDTVLSSIPDQIYLIGHDRRVRFASRSAERALGVSPHRVVGRPWNEIHEATRAVGPALELAFTQARVSEGKAVASTRVGPREFRFLFTPVSGDDGEVDLVLCLGHEVAREGASGTRGLPGGGPEIPRGNRPRPTARSRPSPKTRRAGPRRARARRRSPRT